MTKHHLPSPVCSSVPLPLPSPLAALGVISGFGVVVLLLVAVGCGCFGGLLAYLAAFFRVAVPRAAL